jgi:hypothetical protein
MAFQVHAQLLSGWAVCEWHVVVGNVVEEMNLILGQHQGCGNAVDGSVTPALIEETASLVKVAKVVHVLLGSEPIEIANLEVGPLLISMVSQMKWEE